MLRLDLEKKLTKVLTIGLFAVTVFLSTEGLTDPVNAPKLLILGVVSFAVVGFMFGAKVKVRPNIPLVLLSMFLVASIVSVVRSSSPVSQNLFGSYGRNNGFLAYFFLAILFLGTTLLTQRTSHEFVLKSLLYAGYVNITYCLWVILFGDFVPWNNPYGNILGTFGNPNFIGAFLGIVFGVQLAFVLDANMKRQSRIILCLVLPLTLFEIVDSHAIQGRVLAALSFGIVFFFFLLSKVKKPILWGYSLLITSIGGLSLAGAFQVGPLTDSIYKTSVSLRGQYWLAAWNTGQSNPVSGVGMDSFGDWYRRSRDVHALELPGINTVVNTAHNVPLDMFAFGGWPLLVTYLTIVGFSLRSLIRIGKNIKGYDPIAVGLIAAWTCYQVQSLISINQIGLAIWGWALSGCLIAYDFHGNYRINQPNNSHGTTPRGVKKFHNDEARISLSMASFSLVGFLLALPPVSGDLALRSAQDSRSAMKLESTMNSSLFNPQNSQKYFVNIQTFENSGLFELAHKYSLQAVKWNPESYDLWRALFSVKNATQSERELALLNMKRLDPLNPDVTAIE